MRFCTIVARNYVPFARVLADSVRRHAGERLEVLVLDGGPGDLEPDEPSAEPWSA